MSCDIHLHVEVKIGGVWHHYGVPSVPRKYLLFALMAGVRNQFEVEPISHQRGIPEDSTILTKFDKDRMDGDGHSYSFLTSVEVETLYERYFTEASAFLNGTSVILNGTDDLDSSFGYLFGNSYSSFHRYKDSRPEGLEDFRFIFWFDN